MDPFIGEVIMFGGNFAPRLYARCDGQLLAIANNNALFALFGTIYGGNGSTTFGIPDMRGRLPLHQGRGPGLTTRLIGQKFGSETVNLKTENLPSHNHGIQASKDEGDTNDGAGKVFARSPQDIFIFTDQTTDLVTMSEKEIGNSGGNVPHTNLMPFLCINFCVALEGLFPPRN